MTEEHIQKGSKLIWQETDEDFVPEPAILVEPYCDCIRLSQEDRWINLNYETVKEFIKALKSIGKPE